MTRSHGGSQGGGGLMKGRGEGVDSLILNKLNSLFMTAVSFTGLVPIILLHYKFKGQGWKDKKKVLTDMRRNC